MKKSTIIALIAAIVAAGVAVVTCPDRQDHKDAIMSVVNEDINESSGDDGLAMFFSSIGSGIASRIIDNRLFVKNAFVFSIGKFELPEGGTKTVSLGIFGHVFTMGRENLDEALEDIL